METVAVVIPTLNEARAIGKVIEQIPIDELLNAGLETTAHVVERHSTDNTMDIAREKGAQIVLEGGTGKGAAIRTAFERIDADYVIMVDGDDTYPIDVAEMVRLPQTHDVVVGNMLFTLLARLLFNVKISDVCTGLWGFRRDAIRRLELAAQGFELEADMLAKCVLKGCSIVEIPITYRARENQPKLSSLRDGLIIGLFLCKRRLQQLTERDARSSAESADGENSVEMRV